MAPAIANNARDTTNRTSPEIPLEEIMAFARSYAASCVMWRIWERSRELIASPSRASPSSP